MGQTSDKTKDDKNGLMTPVFRVSFPTLFKPKGYNGGEEKFSVTMLFDKGADLERLRAAVKAAAIARFGEKLPAGLRKPFRDGKEKDLEGYGEGIIFAKATSVLPPEVLNNVRGADGKWEKIPASDERAIYAGCYARAWVVAYAYDNKGKGVSFGLRTIQKVRDAQGFGGGGSKAEMFEDFEESDNAGPSGDSFDDV